VPCELSGFSYQIVADSLDFCVWATSAPTVQSNPTEVQAAPTPVQVALPVDLAAAIVQGYSNYWTVRVNALRDPDPANPDLESVMVGTELSRAQQLLSGYQQQGTAYDSDVKHQIWITQASADVATVVDRYVATSGKVQPTSLELVTPGSAPNVERLATTFSLQNIGGTWKVVDQISHVEGTDPKKEVKRLHKKFPSLPVAILNQS